MAPYINLDNAASTPPLRDVRRGGAAIPPVLLERAPRHRLQVACQHRAYDEAHDAIARFVGADTTREHGHLREEHHRGDQQAGLPLPVLSHRDVILSTVMEHHSNDLPWRGARRSSERRHSRRTLDEDDVDRLLAAYGERVALVTVSGASNVTGFVQPIHRLARKAHDVGARILVDAAQLAPHRRIDVQAATTTRSTSISSCSPPTRCTRRSAPARWSVVATRSCKVRPNIRGAAPSRSSPRPTCTGRASPIARKPAVPTSSAPWRWRRRRRR